MNLPTFEIGDNVINLSRTLAIVVGFDVHGPILRSLRNDGSVFGGKWVASPDKCRIVPPVTIKAAVSETFTRITNVEAKAAIAPKAKRVRVPLVCLECGKKFRVSPNASPECPKCGGTDWEVE